MIDNGEEEDLQDKENLLIIQAAAAAAIAAGLCAMEHAQQFCDKRHYHDSALSGIDKDGFDVSPEQEDQFKILVAVGTFTLFFILSCTDHLVVK